MNSSRGGADRQTRVVLRFGSAPLRGFIETIGVIVLLFRRTAVSALTLPFNHGPELVDQFLFALRPGWFPMILATLALTNERAGIEVGNFLNHYPTASRAALGGGCVASGVPVGDVVIPWS